MEVGSAIRQLRRSQKGLNQSQFANKIGITQTYLSQIESGKKTPSMSVLQTIGVHLEIPFPILFWFCLTIDDIQESKRKHFKFLKPSIDAMIDSII